MGEGKKERERGVSVMYERQICIEIEIERLSEAPFPKLTHTVRMQMCYHYYSPPFPPLPLTFTHTHTTPTHDTHSPPPLFLLRS